MAIRTQTRTTALMPKDSSYEAALNYAYDLLRIMREISVAIRRLQEEKLALDYVLGRLTQALQLDSGAILMREGDQYSLVAYHQRGKEGGAPLPRLLDLAEQLMHDGANDVMVITDPTAFNLPVAARRKVQTLILAPLTVDGIPMGVIVFAHAITRGLQLAEMEMLRLMSHLLASRLREMRLLEQMANAERRLAASDPAAHGDIDPDTGLASKKAFMTGLQHMIENALNTGGQCSLMMVEIDQFGMVANLDDEYRNSILIRVAEAIQGCVRAGDLAARCEEDKFGVLLPTTSGVSAVVVADRLRERVASLDYQGKQTTWQATISISVTSLSNRVSLPSQFIDKAFESLTEARLLGGNQVIFDWDEALEVLDEG